MHIRLRPPPVRGRQLCVTRYAILSSPFRRVRDRDSTTAWAGGRGRARSGKWRPMRGRGRGAFTVGGVQPVGARPESAGRRVPPVRAPSSARTNLRTRARARAHSHTRAVHAHAHAHAHVHIYAGAHRGGGVGRGAPLYNYIYTMYTIAQKLGNRQTVKIYSNLKLG